MNVLMISGKDMCLMSTESASIVEIGHLKVVIVIVENTSSTSSLQMNHIWNSINPMFSNNEHPKFLFCEVCACCY